MASCAVRCGFFVLRDCGEPQAQVCAACARPACAAHVRTGPAGPLCLDCAAKADDGNLDDDAGVYGYRRSFYAQAGYAPLYMGLAYDPFYSSYDVRGFTAGRGGVTGSYGDDASDYDDGPASFADS